MTIVDTNWPDLCLLNAAFTIHDRFATRADKREGANSSLVHIAQVTTVLGSEGWQGSIDLQGHPGARTSAYQREAS